jgi:hypothetical protein
MPPQISPSLTSMDRSFPCTPFVRAPIVAPAILPPQTSNMFYGMTFYIERVHHEKKTTLRLVDAIRVCPFPLLFLNHGIDEWYSSMGQNSTGSDYIHYPCSTRTSPVLTKTLPVFSMFQRSRKVKDHPDTFQIPYAICSSTGVFKTS